MTNAREGWLTEERIATIQRVGFDRPFGRDSFMPSDLNALCRMALAALEQEWRSIETAPKDGTPFLVPMKSANYPNAQAICKWVENDKCFWTDGNQRVTPTHWLPLPTPSKEA